jgi:cell division protease FtsH
MTTPQDTTNTSEREPPGLPGAYKTSRGSVPLARDVDLGELASSTPGFSGADLANLVNEAALLAAWREQEEVRQKDFLDALERIVLGPRSRC